MIDWRVAEDSHARHDDDSTSDRRRRRASITRAIGCPSPPRLRQRPSGGASVARPLQRLAKMRTGARFHRFISSLRRHFLLPPPPPAISDVVKFKMAVKGSNKKSHFELN